MVMSSSSAEPQLGSVPIAHSGVGSSDLNISSLFEEIARCLRVARNASDLSNLRRLLTDINFELTKYGSIPLASDSWRPKLDFFVQDILRNVQIQPIFALDIRDIENDTAAMIDHLMGDMVGKDGAKDLARNLQWHLQVARNCAKSPALPRIRAFGYWKISELRKNLPITTDILSEYLPLIIFLLEGFKEDDSGIAQSASDATLLLVKHFNITNILHPGFEYARKLVDIIDEKTVSGRTDVVKFRVFEFVEKILLQNLGSVSDVLQLGLMEKLFSSFRTMDLLALANNCEAMARFADHSIGLQLLEESGGMRLAEDLLEAKKDSHDLEYFAPYLFRLYITLAIKHPEYCILKREKVTLLAHELILRQHGHSGAAALEYISQLASQSNAGKRYLHNLRLPSSTPFMTGILEFIGKTLSGTIRGTPMDDACLRDFSFLVKHVVAATPQSDSELQSINRDWFNAAGGGRLFSALFQKAQNPFKDVKIPVMGVFRAMADQVWGMEQFRDEPGFVEFLVNRLGESDKDVKEVKFDIIKAMVEAEKPGVMGVFDGVTVIRLREYVRDGPFYVPGQHHVASEGGA